MMCLGDHRYSKRYCTVISQAALNWTIAFEIIWILEHLPRSIKNKSYAEQEIHCTIDDDNFDLHINVYVSSRTTTFRNEYNLTADIWQACIKKQTFWKETRRARLYLVQTKTNLCYIYPFYSQLKCCRSEACSGDAFDVHVYHVSQLLLRYFYAIAVHRPFICCHRPGC